MSYLKIKSNLRGVLNFFWKATLSNSGNQNLSAVNKISHDSNSLPVSVLPGCICRIIYNELEKNALSIFEKFSFANFWNWQFRVRSLKIRLNVIWLAFEAHLFYNFHIKVHRNLYIYILQLLLYLYTIPFFH